VERPADSLPGGDAGAPSRWIAGTSDATVLRPVQRQEGLNSLAELGRAAAPDGDRDRGIDPLDPAPEDGPPILRRGSRSKSLERVRLRPQDVNAEPRQRRIERTGVELAEASSATVHASAARPAHAASSASAERRAVRNSVPPSRSSITRDRPSRTRASAS
jgi:hypothetical protein